MHQYFKTGKTIVIDDQYNEAKPLLDALCKKHIPFVYTQGKPNSEYPLPNIETKDAQFYSLIFLDLNLDFKFAGSQISNDTEEKTFKGFHSNILNTIIKNENRSFVIVIWSNEEENYLEHYLNIFESKKYTSKIPYKVLTLNKPKFFDLTPTGYEFKKDENGDSKQYEDLLFEEINNSLSDLEAFKFFCEWERVVLQSIGDTIDDFMGLINRIKDENERELHLAKVITSISVAYSGVEGFINLKSDQEKTDAVLLALTQILNDDIDRNVLYERQAEFTKWEATNKEEIKKVNSEVNPYLLNHKLLVFKPNRKDLTGAIYKTDINSDLIKLIYFSSFDSSSICKEFIKHYKKENNFDISPKMIENLTKRYTIKQILKESIAIELNVSPLCDVVQNKIIEHRILKGLIIPIQFYDKIKNSDYFIKSPLFAYNELDVFIGIDLRTFTSCSKKEIESKEYLFTLRANLANDIQTKLGAHVSRLGVLFL
jgi:hypothetical protein